MLDCCLQGLIQGKLDQKSLCFVVKYAVGRDTHHEDIDDMIQKLTNWKTQSAEICEKINSILRYEEHCAPLCVWWGFAFLTFLRRVQTSLAEKQEDDERKREDDIRAKMAARATERGKGFASSGGNFRPGEEFNLYSDAGPRRG
jgi:hypothetical protein